jgi:transcription elongation factor GreA
MAGDGMVRVGSLVEVRDGQFEESWRIVDAAESDPRRGRISEESPMARALLGRRAGDEVRVQGPEGRRPVTILRVV